MKFSFIVKKNINLSFLSVRFFFIVLSSVLFLYPSYKYPKFGPILIYVHYCKNVTAKDIVKKLFGIKFFFNSILQ